jgi:hypothetical protein
MLTDTLFHPSVYRILDKLSNPIYAIGAPPPQDAENCEAKVRNAAFRKNKVVTPTIRKERPIRANEAVLPILRFNGPLCGHG